MIKSDFKVVMVVVFNKLLALSYGDKLEKKRSKTRGQRKIAYIYHSLKIL